jgi:hypothetical protein
VAKFDFAALGRLQGKLALIAHPDPTPFLEGWEKIIVEDNKRGILQSRTDKNDQPLTGVTYWPKGAPLTVGKAASARQKIRTAFTGPIAAGFDENLTSSQYRRLSGPPTTPRGANSRVITHLNTGHGYDSSRGAYFAEARWLDIVSKTGYNFLPDPLKRWPLDGLRAWGRQQCVGALQKWGNDLLQQHWG